MTKKKTVLQCACNFTRAGLEALIRGSVLTTSLELVASSDNIEHGEMWTSCLPTVDVTILMPGHNCNLASILHLVGGVLPQTHPHSKVVLMGERAHMEMLRRYISTLMGTWYILDHTTSLETLCQQLQGIALSDEDEGISTANPGAKLTARELLVLRKLLNSETSSQIASGLQLNYRTVSHYKRAALAKLGIRSLCPLIMLTPNKHIVHRRPEYLTRDEIQATLQADSVLLTTA